MFKNRRSTLVAKKPSELAVIREGTTDTQEPPVEKVRRLASNEAPVQEPDDPFGSQFSVPASQMNSQRRYLSQRSNLQKSQSARTSRRIPVNYFESVLLKCQVELDDPTSMVLRCEPITFVRAIRTMLRASVDYPRNVSDFIGGVEQASKNGESFRKLLECCQIQSERTGDQKSIQESLMKMLLCVEFMQAELISFLFEYVEKAARNNDTTGINLTGLVLSQIRFIDQTQHGTLVFNKYFEVLENCGRGQLVKEAIVSLQDVIDVSMQDTAFRKIMDLIAQPAELFTATNLSVFCEMCLSGATLRTVRQKIVDYVDEECPGEIYPVLVKFLLKFNGNETDCLHENIREIRQVVQRAVQSFDNDAGDPYLQEIFQIIYQALTVSSTLYDAWVRFCRLLTDEDSHLPVDLLILLVMLTVNELKSATIQRVLIDKLRKRHLTIKHMEYLTKHFGCVLKTYLDCVLDFLESCLKERNTEVCEFGITAMTYLFSANSLNNKLVLNKLVGFMCEMALINEGQRNDHLVAVCLNALSNICSTYPNDVRNCAHILLKIMDVSTDLSLSQYRSAVSMVCDAIHVPDKPINDNEYWENIHIIIRKQLLSKTKSVKMKGVVGVVRMIRHLLKVSTESSDDSLPSSFNSETTIVSVSDIPTASGREIANMINMMLASPHESTDILALCYDELADMLQDFESTVGPPEKASTVWLCDMLTADFQKYFVTDEPQTGDVMQFATKLCINDTSEIEDTNEEAYTIAINIAANVLAYNSRYSTMCFFLPMFKLLKSLQSIRYNGNLETINALLGCAIVLPTFYGEFDEGTFVETYEEDVCRQLFDAYFYLANWFRELINAFIRQPDQMLHRKVLQRLTALVNIGQRLADLLKTTDFDYYPPICDFYASIAPSSKTSRTAKDPTASKANATINPTGRTQMDSTSRNRPTAGGNEFDNETVFARYRRGFRLMEGRTIRLLGEPLLLCCQLPEEKLGKAVGLAEYRFLLETVGLELEMRANSRTAPTPNYRLEDVLDVLPCVVNNFMKIRVKHMELGRSMEASIQTEFKALGCCSNWTLRIFTATLLLVRTQPNDFESKTLQILSKLAGTFEEDKTNDELVEALLSAELVQQNACNDLGSASYIYKFGCALNGSASTPASSTVIANFCQHFICSTFNLKSGTTAQLTLLLQGLFTTVDFTKIKRLTKALSEDLLASKTDERILAGLQRSHYPLLFKELTKAFIRCIQAELRSRKTTVQKFVLWENSSEILKQFSEVSKQADNFKIYGCYMRYAHTFLKLFQQAGLKTLEDVLKVSADRVSHLLNTLQHSTRYLHNICCHSKHVKDSNLAAQVPFIRETVETLIYTVKAVLAANDCASVFWMGNLKNKDLKGELIVSQQVAEDMEPDDEDESITDDEDFLSEEEGGGDGGGGGGDGESGRGEGLRRATALRRQSTAKSSQSKCF